LFTWIKNEIFSGHCSGWKLFPYQEDRIDSDPANIGNLSAMICQYQESCDWHHSPVPGIVAEVRADGGNHLQVSLTGWDRSTESYTGAGQSVQ
jgi:hypothetical protein